MGALLVVFCPTKELISQSYIPDIVIGRLLEGTKVPGDRNCRDDEIAFEGFMHF